MKAQHIDFTKQLIKGRIAETLFEVLFRQEIGMELIPYGYEYNTPLLLAKKYKSPENEDTLNSIRHSPDFIIVDQDGIIKLVEVKYRKNFDEKENLKTVKEIFDSSNHAWLFLVTHEGFYFEKCKSIIEHNGQIDKLSASIIDDEIQREYLQLLNEF